MCVYVCYSGISGNSIQLGVGKANTYPPAQLRQMFIAFYKEYLCILKNENAGVPWWPSVQVSSIVTAVVHVQSLAWELPRASGTGEKKS